MSEEKDVLFALLEENVLDQNGNAFKVSGAIEFLEDDIVGKYIKIPSGGYINIGNPGFAVGYGDFTMDCWVYNNGNAAFGTWPIEGSGISIILGSLAVCRGQGRANSYSGIAINNIVKYGWAHYAIVRKGVFLYVFVNGVLAGSGKNHAYASHSSYGEAFLSLNAKYSNGSYAYGENCYKAIRFSNYARWTEDCTPPDPLHLLKLTV